MNLSRISMNTKLSRAAARIQKLSALRPRLAVILGSGFHHVLSAMTVEGELDYGRIPGFPAIGVSGHAGRLYVGRIGACPVLALSGRAHFYEGHSLEAVTFAVRALAACGVRDLLLTNAAGGINRKFRPGDFMVLTDHINLMGANPLRGPALEGRPRFIDLTAAYDRVLSRHLCAAGQAARLNLRKGVYLAVGGPTYETPAEVRAFARLGADAVGMSTVPETIVARQCGMRVAAVSCITNLAAGVSRTPLSHAEVLETAGRVKDAAAQMLQNFAERYAGES